MNIFSFFTAINHKKDLLKDEPQAVILYNSAMINQLLSQYPDAILHVNEMNSRPNCDDKLQFDYFLHSLRKGDRNIQTRTGKQSYLDDNNLELVKEYYGFSTSKAKTALEILTDDELESIRKRLFKGGTSS